MSNTWQIDPKDGVLDISLSDAEKTVLDNNYYVDNIHWDSCLEPSFFPKRIAIPSHIMPDQIKAYLKDKYQCIPLKYDLVAKECPMYFFAIHSNNGRDDIAMGHNLQALIDLASSMKNIISNNADILPIEIYSDKTVIHEYEITRDIYEPGDDGIVYTKKVWSATI